MAENRELALILKLVADQFKKELKESEGALGSFGRLIQDQRVQVAAVAGAIFAIAKSTANFGEEALKAAQKTGDTVERITALKFAAHLSDIGLQDLTKGLKFLSQNMVEAQRGTGDGAQVLKDLGVSAMTTAGQLKLPSDVLLEVADRFAATKDGAAKAELAVKLFGRQGIELIPFLNQGKAGIQALMEEARRLGVVMNDEDAQAANAFNDNLKRLQSQLTGVKLAIGTELIPVLNELTQILLNLGQGPVGSSVSLFFKSLLFSMQEAGIEIGAVAAKYQVFQEKLSAAAQREALKAINEAKERDLEVLAARLSGEQIPGLTLPPPRPGPKGEIAPAEDRAAQAKLLEDQKKAREKALKEEFELVKIGLARLRLQYDQDLTEGRISLEQNVEVKNGIREKEFDEEGALLIRLKDATVQFYQARVALGFKNKDERLSIETTFKNDLAGLDQQILKSTAERNKALDQGALDSLNARLTKEREALALLFAGAESLRADRDRDAADAVTLAQAKVSAAELELQGIEGLAAARERVVIAQMAKELDLTQEQVRQLIQARIDGEAELEKELLARGRGTDLQKEAVLIQGTARFVREQRLQVGGFLEGWREGLVRYTRDIESTFGLAQDMARRSAQAMEQSFKTFFFDLFEGRIQSFKDVLRGLLNFVKEIMAQVAAQMAVVGIFKGLGIGSLLLPTPAPAAVPVPGGFQHGGTFVVPGFGGPDSNLIRFLATPGERVTVETPAQQRAGQAQSGGPPIITVQITNPGRTDRPQVSVREGMRELVLDILWSELRSNGDFARMLQQGGVG